RCCTSDDVDDRIDGSDLVKVNVVDRHAMNFGLGSGELRERPKRTRLDGIGELRPFERGANLFEGAFGLRSVDVHVEVRGNDAAPNFGLPVNVKPFEAAVMNGVHDDIAR